MDDQRPERALCVLGCRSRSGYPFPADNGYLTCDRCATRLRATAVEIPPLYGQIMDPDVLLYRESPGGRPPKGYHSQPPASLHLMSLRDPRTTCAEPGDLHSALNVVWWYATKVRELHGLPAPALRPTVAGEVSTLLFHWDWIMRQRWVPDFARDIREVHTQLAHAIPGGDTAPKRVGSCTHLLDSTDEERGRRVCGQSLYLPTTGKTITCGGCGHQYKPEALINLHVAQRQAQP